MVHSKNEHYFVKYLFQRDICVYICLVSSVVADSLRSHGMQQPRLPCPSPSPDSLLKLMSIESLTY